jgi:signal-transduction protein with cAMP-binding, CBS, and nucleotidyltransferase domain
MQLRLQTQLTALQSGQALRNTIRPARLGAMQQEYLKQAFSQISAVQKKISYDFLGGM